MELQDRSARSRGSASMIHLFCDSYPKVTK
jgi:hypothetical protein